MEENKKPQFQRSVEACRIVNQLEIILQENKKFISYEELGRAANVDLKTSTGYGKLTTARKHMREAYHVHFEPVRGQGLNLCSDSEVVQRAVMPMRLIRNKVRREKRILGLCADPKNLTQEERTAQNGHLTVMAFTEELYKGKNVKKIIAACEKASSALTAQKTIEAFKDGSL